jgi:hypothetical protein
VRDTRDRFTLRMSQEELVVSGTRCPPRVIALDRIDGFVGDDRLRLQLVDGTTVALPCALARAENEALAASLSEALARKRANAADYRGERIRVGAEEEEETPGDESARARR